MQTQVPPYEETKKRILAVKDQKWLDAKVAEIETIYGNNVQDPAFKLWLVATQNGIDAGQIKMETSGEGTPTQLCDLTPELAQREMDLDEKDRGFYSVEGVILNLRHGETSKGKSKLDFDLVDGTGKVKVTFYESSIPLFTNARTQEGDYVRIPQAGVFGFQFPADKRNPEGRFWYSLTVPPFGDIQKSDKDPEGVFRRIDAEAANDGDAVLVEGIPTHVQTRTNDVCSKCNRWVKEDDEENADEHSECENAETVKKTTYEATISTGTGFYKVRFPERMGKPTFQVARDWIRLYGWWTKRGTVTAVRYVIGRRGETNGSNQASTPAVRPAPAPVKPAAKAPTPPPAAPTPAPTPPASDAVTAAPTPANGAKEVPGVPPQVVDHVRKMTQPYGGQNRVLIIVNNGAENGIVPPTPEEAALPADQQKTAIKNRLLGYVGQCVQGGLLEYVDQTQKTVKWAA